MRLFSGMKSILANFDLACVDFYWFSEQNHHEGIGLEPYGYTNHYGVMAAMTLIKGMV